MRVKVNMRDVLADKADHNDLLLSHGGAGIDDLLEAEGIARAQELDVREPSPLGPRHVRAFDDVA